MSNSAKTEQQATAVGEFFGAMWKHRLWWMLPLGVLIGLLVGIYALAHLSKTDSEMYPTSETQRPTLTRLC